MRICWLRVRVILAGVLETLCGSNRRNRDSDHKTDVPAPHSAASILVLYVILSMLVRVGLKLGLTNVNDADSEQ